MLRAGQTDPPDEIRQALSEAIEIGRMMQEWLETGEGQAVCETLDQGTCTAGVLMAVFAAGVRAGRSNRANS